MADTKKTLYHSELSGLGPVTVKVTTDVLKSKYSKPGNERPDYVGILLNGEERTYNTENAECAEFFRNQKGRTFSIVAEGSRDDARIVYVGEPMAPGDQIPGAEVPATPPPATKPINRPPPPPVQPRQTPPPAVTAPAAPASRPPAPAPKPPGQHDPIHGATVGMCMKEAVGVCNTIGGLDPFSAQYYESVYWVASDLIRLCLLLDSGKLAPSAKTRNPEPEQ